MTISQELLPASFKGVPFFWRTDSLTAGQKTIVELREKPNIGKIVISELLFGILFCYILMIYFAFTGKFLGVVILFISLLEFIYIFISFMKLYNKSQGVS